MKKYEPKAIEPKWQKIWADTNLYSAKDTDKARTKYYMLTEFPYPSAEGLHAGHAREYTVGDVVARHKRMQGYNVLYPMGWDAFGLPTENYAIKRKLRPQDATARNVDNFRRQMVSLGFSFDWSREVNTTDPNYYRWTQWIFLQLLKAGLAYHTEMPINWCPKCKTGLANEEVIDGKHERCGTPVEKKLLKQWVLKITDYADRLVDGLKTVDFPSRIADQQINWIGRSEGAEIDFEVAGQTITVFTTRPDTLAGATFLVLAPEHAALAKITTADRRVGVESYIKTAQRETPLEREEVDRPKTGAFTGAYAKNPITGHPMPVWVADYVLGNYGTGAIMAVPAHDERDLAFAKAMNEAIGSGDYPTYVDDVTPPRPELPFEDRRAALAIVQHPSDDKYLVLELKGWQTNVVSFPMGGIDDGETVAKAALRELLEETGYDHVAHVTELGSPYVAEFYHEYKKVNRRALVYPVIVKLADLHKQAVSPAERDLRELRWVTAKDALSRHHGEGARAILQTYLDGRSTPHLNVVPVIEPVTGTPNGNDHVKQAIVAVVHDGRTKRTLMLDWGPRQRNWGGTLFVGGGVDDGEDLVQAAIREIAEETGYVDVKFTHQTEVPVNNYYYSNVKDRHDLARMHGLYFELLSNKQQPIKLDDGERNKFQPIWVDDDAVLSKIDDPGHELVYRMLTKHEAYEGEGILVNSGQFNGLAGIEAKRAVTKWLFEQGKGHGATKYRLRDWIFSRQRYWGEPIPIIHCAACGAVPVPEKQLPVTLPAVEHYEPTDTGQSPLAAITDWVNTACPKCGGPAKRETDTMPNWAGSSWYWLRYVDPHNDREFAARKTLDYWGMVDFYLGGMEHTTLHLLYSRFWHQFLYDQKLVPTPEPFAARRGQGIVLANDGRKMSKSVGNVVNPTDIIERYGADAFRLYILFMAPYDETTPWSDERLNGVSRFVHRVWTLVQELMSNKSPSLGDSEIGTGELVTAVDRMTHKTLKRVNDDLEGLRLNTMVAALMEYVNFLNEPQTKAALLQPVNADLAIRTAKALVLMLAPAAPHITEELWHELGEEGSVHLAPWPIYDPGLLKDDITTMIVQVNGKLRGELPVSVDASDAEVSAAALALPSVSKHTKGQHIVKTIVVPRKIVNFVVRP